MDILSWDRIDPNITSHVEMLVLNRSIMQTFVAHIARESKV